MSMCRFCLAPLCVVASAALPAQAAGQDTPTTVVTAPAETFTERVGYADLDLMSPSDRQILLRRVGKAVNDVCSESLGPSPIFYAQTSCRNWTWAQSRPQIDRAFDSAGRFTESGPVPTAMVIVVAASRAD